MRLHSNVNLNYKILCKGESEASAKQCVLIRKLKGRDSGASRFTFAKKYNQYEGEI